MKYLKTFRKRDMKSVAHIVETEGRLRVMAEIASGWTEWPIKAKVGTPAWQDTLILYHHPERVPFYVKLLVEEAFNELEFLNALTR